MDCRMFDRLVVLPCSIHNFYQRIDIHALKNWEPFIPNCQRKYGYFHEIL